MHDQAFIELSLVILTTLVICGAFRMLKQPIMIGYIVSGIVLSPNLLGFLKNSEGLSTFSQIGISFLLFMVGLGLNPKHIRDIGKTAVFTTLVQMFLSGGFFFLLSLLFGFNTTTALYLGLGLSFSSTIVIMKILTDKLSLETLPGKIAIGILIIQDLLAMIALMTISAIAKDGNLMSTIIETAGKGLVLGVTLILISTKILPVLARKIASSQEMLLLFSIAWCMAVASLFYLMDFSIEIGALLAGITLSLSPYRYEISAKMRPLRDFFIMLFFVFLGSQMVFGEIVPLLLPTLVFTILVLVLNPLIITFLMGRIGYTKKTSFLAGINFSQISEFSLIVATLGVKVGHLDQKILSLLTLIALLTITGSTYFINYSEKVYRRISRQLDIFEKKGPKIDQQRKRAGREHEIILIGYGRMGISLVESFKLLGKSYFIVDYDPQVIQDLESQHVDCLYADISNLDTYDEINFNQAKMVISTVKDFDTNLLLINSIKKVNKEAIILTLSHQIDESIRLYEQGANYVIMPFQIGGHQTSSMIAEYGFDIQKFLIEKNQHISRLLIRKALKKTSYF